VLVDKSTQLRERRVDLIRIPVPESVTIGIEAASRGDVPTQGDPLHPVLEFRSGRERLTDS